MNIKYNLTNGEIICAGSLKDVPFTQSEGLLEVEDRNFDIRAFKVVNGILVEKTSEEKEIYLYAEKRRAEYPSVVDQLDAIWKGGTDMETMRQRIIAIKEKYPRPNA